MPPETIVKTHTATDDNIFKLTTTNQPLWFEEINIHCKTNNARYGDLSTSQTVGGQVSANATLSFRIFNLNDMYFCNDTAGANTTITAVGNRMLPARMKELGLI